MSTSRKTFDGHAVILNSILSSNEYSVFWKVWVNTKMRTLKKVLSTHNFNPNSQSHLQSDKCRRLLDINSRQSNSSYSNLSALKQSFSKNKFNPKGTSQMHMSKVKNWKLLTGSAQTFTFIFKLND